MLSAEIRNTLLFVPNYEYQLYSCSEIQFLPKQILKIAKFLKNVDKI